MIEEKTTRSGWTHEKSIKGATDVWLTPIQLIRALGEFDLDPCAHPGWITAKEMRFEPDGLKSKWHGRVWLNPPYSKNAEFMDWMRHHGDGIALVFARTETKWFHDTVWYEADSIFFFEKRITFHRADGSPASGSAGAPSCLIAYGRKNAQAITRASNAETIKGKHVWLKD